MGLRVTPPDGARRADDPSHLADGRCRGGVAVSSTDPTRSRLGPVVLAGTGYALAFLAEGNGELFLMRGCTEAVKGGRIVERSPLSASSMSKEL